jgi:hypothetical protein
LLQSSRMIEAQRPFQTLRFLEIGLAPFVKTAFPAQTEFFRANPRLEPDEPGEPIGFRRLVDRLRSDAIDLVICQPPALPLWHPQALSRLLFNRKLFSTGFAPHRALAFSAVKRNRQVPVAVMDLEDYAHIDWWNFGLIDRATLYFKRELPPDEWRLFSKTGTSTLPSGRFRRSERFRERAAKLRPVSLGMPTTWAPDLPTGHVEKKTDVFFAGNVSGMPVRERGVAELKALAAEGIRVDIPEGRLPRAEFYKRCAEAWLIWSPEGYGWDCFRHYEAPACGTVPLQNVPSIRRHAPTHDGEHAFFHGPEEGELARTIRMALGDKERLVRMAAAAKAHLEAHHTGEAIARHVVEATLAAAKGGG